MKKSIIVSLLILFGIISTVTINSCATTQAIADKSGATLWGENCVRCHNTPSPADYSDMQWDVAGMHMKNRANLTSEEIGKIIEFMKSAN